MLEALHRRGAAGRRLGDRCLGHFVSELRHAGLPPAGPGYDTRPSTRSPRQHRPQAEEADQALRRDTRQCHSLPIDFEARDLADVLAHHSYRPERATFKLGSEGVLGREVACDRCAGKPGRRLIRSSGKAHHREISGNVPSASLPTRAVRYVPGMINTHIRRTPEEAFLLDVGGAEPRFRALSWGSRRTCRPAGLALAQSGLHRPRRPGQDTRPVPPFEYQSERGHCRALPNVGTLRQSAAMPTNRCSPALPQRRRSSHPRPFTGS